MKYKNIHSAIHNFGHSFLSLMNYVDGEYVIDELNEIRAKGLDVEIDWLSGSFTPPGEITPRIKKAIEYYADGLREHMRAQHVDLDGIKAMKLHLPAKGRKHMWARDDRDKEYKIYVSEIK